MAREVTKAMLSKEEKRKMTATIIDDPVRAAIAGILADNTPVKWEKLRKLSETRLGEKLTDGRFNHHLSYLMLRKVVAETEDGYDLTPEGVIVIEELRKLL